MILAIDIGNTNIVLGGYENGALGFCTRISTDKSLEADQYALELSGILNLYKVAGENIEGAIISSVVPQITDTVARHHLLRRSAGNGTLPECGRKSHQKAGQSGWTRREDRS